MSAFTNRDRDMVREFIAAQPGGLVKIGKDTLEALLARLEDAERFVTESHCQNGCTCDGECPIHLPLYRALEKSAGLDRIGENV